MDLGETLQELGANRRLAHNVLFSRRHPLPTPDFHWQIIDAFHAEDEKVVIEAFRNAAKSTIAEEALTVAALFRDFRNCVIIGASFERAKERLSAIKNELVVNDSINALFGSMEGPVWGEGRIVLKNGICLTALGAGMSLRGTKYLDARPDMALIDDLEDEESVRTPEAREKMRSWLYRAFLPALDVNRRIRFLGNQLDTDAVIVSISKDPSWRHVRFPVMRQEAGGGWRPGLPPGSWLPLWPEKYSLDWIGKERAEYERQGLSHAFACEYMCEAGDPAGKVFTPALFRVSDRTRVWEAVYAAYDPARTVSSTSASTGKVVFSWVSNRLVVWQGEARFWLPDELVDDIIATDDRWSPVAIGVEATGLEEFILQPLRHRALMRGHPLPVRLLKPPRGKDDFIRSLQPYFKAGEVEFVDPGPEGTGGVSAEARGQLLSFPTGRKDFPNALAYALLMRPGLPVYENFSSANVTVAPPFPAARAPWWLAAHATHAYTAAVLVQIMNTSLRVQADWVREGTPGEVLGDMVTAARLEAGSAVRLAAPPVTLNDTVGLRVAARHVPVDVSAGGAPVKGREIIREKLTRTVRGEPALLIHENARWTLNAFGGGYCYETGRRGTMLGEPVQGPYQVLMTALESFAAQLSLGLSEAEDGRRYAMTDDGRRYTTILAGEHG